MRDPPLPLASLKEPNLYHTTAGAVQCSPAQRVTLVLYVCMAPNSSSLSVGNTFIASSEHDIQAVKHVSLGILMPESLMLCIFSAAGSITTCDLQGCL